MATPSDPAAALSDWGAAAPEGRPESSPGRQPGVKDRYAKSPRSDPRTPAKRQDLPTAACPTLDRLFPKKPHDATLEPDLTLPILLFANDTVLNGMHRLVRATLLGLQEVSVVQFEPDPEPDDHTINHAPS